MASGGPPQYYRSQFGDTTLTKVFVGGLAWETPTEEVRTYFQQFGEILEAVIITEKITGKSKGYGFVTFREPESARRACADPNPVIDGRRANCNIASLGRPRPSPPPGRLNQGGNPYQGTPQSYSRTAASVPPPVIFPPYGYPTYNSEYGYHAGLYSPQGAGHHHMQQQQQPQYYQQQVYGGSSTCSYPYTTYYYGGGPGSYSMMSPRGEVAVSQGMATTGPSAVVGSYLCYYPAASQMDNQGYPPAPAPPLHQPPTHHPFLPHSSSSDSQSSTPQNTSMEAGGAGGVPSGTPKP